MSNEKIIAVQIDANLFQALGNYLVTRPYAEVSELIRALEKSTPIMESESAPEPSGDDLAEK